jgi:hypothetical protein
MNYTSRILRTAGALLALTLLTPTTNAQSVTFTFSVDVPSDLAGTGYLANQTVMHSQGAYSLDFDGPMEGLQPDVNLDALIVMEDGSFLFSADAPFTAGSTTFEPGDLVRFHGGSYYMFVSGADLRLPAGANIDAVARDLDGQLVISVGAPASVAGSDYMADDVIRIDGLTLSLAVSGQQLGLPAGTNIVGLEREPGGDWFFLFDVPVEVGGSTFRPGSIVRHDGVDFSQFFTDPAFPAASVATDFSFPGSPGDVSELLIGKTAGGIELSWTASCSSEADDYAVYEGAIGSWYGHSPALCSTGGANQTEITPQTDDRYFLVVPVNDMFEGSYGATSAPGERPALSGACLADQRLAVCPVS